MVAVNIKWNKQVFENVEFDINSNVLTFKTKVQLLTGVPTGRQKLMAKGGWVGILKDDNSDLSKVKEGQLISLIGTADVAVKPVEIQFLEDMTVDQLAETGTLPSAGLINLPGGNTCYMNSTIQCLRQMPELRTALKTVIALDSDNEELKHNLALSREFSETVQTADNSGEAIAPVKFIKKLREHWPNPFAQQGQNGYFVQQGKINIIIYYT
jgi:ubiquitin carboxyl-terminal hydrolase 14